MPLFTTSPYRSLLTIVIAAIPLLVTGIAVAGGQGFLSEKQKTFNSWKTVGFLSMGNYNTVHHLIPNATPIIMKHIEDLEAAVKNGTIDAALISGTPTNEDQEFVLYNSGSISPRGMMTRKNDTISRHFADATIVRLLMTGALFGYAQRNAPFDFVEVHTCRSSNPDLHFPFPNITPSSTTSSSRDDNNSSSAIVLRVGALGPYNWAQDGDYTASPPTGFWPDVLGGLNEVLSASSSSGVGIVFERKFYSSSVEVMDALARGDVDVTEPYWTIDSFYNDRPRLWTFDSGCLVLGYESTFFAKKKGLIATIESASATVIALAILAGIICVLLLILFIVFCIKSFFLQRHRRTLIISSSNAEGEQLRGGDERGQLGSARRSEEEGNPHDPTTTTSPTSAFHHKQVTMVNAHLPTLTTMANPSSAESSPGSPSDHHHAEQFASSA